MELACFAGLYQLSRILECCRLVEAMPKGLANKRARGGMASTLASMDLHEQLTALSLGNAPHEDTIGATAVEIPFYHCVEFSQSYYALSGRIIIRKNIVFQVVPDLRDPCIGSSLSRWEWLYEVSRILNRAHNPGRGTTGEMPPGPLASWC